MSYHILPKKTKQAVITVLTLIIYSIIFGLLKTTFPDISIELKRYLSQYGLFVIFASALLASISIFWSSKVQHNRDLAESEINSSSENLRVLELQIAQLGIDLSESIKHNEEKRYIANEKLREANAYPEFVRFSGYFSIAVLAVGTLMCVVGAG